MTSTNSVRILVVDSSAEVRRLITAYLSTDPLIEVVGVATNLSGATRQIEQLQPDIVTLEEDLYSIAISGAYRHSTEKLTQVPIVVLGNIDDSTKEVLTENLFHKDPHSRIKRKRAIVCKTPDERRFTEICRRIHQIAKRIPALTNHQIDTIPGFAPATSGIIGIAVSTGGPNALIQIISQLSPTLAVPILVTQHMPEQFTPLLVERLNLRGTIPVYEAHDGQPLEAGSIYVAPGDRHIKVKRKGTGHEILLCDGPKENSCRPSADVMFRSIAENFGTRALGLVLTGMGVDGQRGSHHIKERGGLVIAQDEGSSTVWGMPKAVIEAGLADEILALNDIPEFINLHFTKREDDQ